MRTITYTKCLTPLSSYHLLLVKLDTSEPLVTLTSPDGLSFNASFVHGGTGAIVRHVTVNLQGPSTIYLARAEKVCLQGWYYVLQFSEYFKRYGCSCLEGKTQGYCKHIGSLESLAHVA